MSCPPGKLFCAKRNFIFQWLQSSNLVVGLIFLSQVLNFRVGRSCDPFVAKVPLVVHDV